MSKEDANSEVDGTAFTGQYGDFVMQLRAQLDKLAHSAVGQLFPPPWRNWVRQQFASKQSERMGVCKLHRKTSEWLFEAPMEEASAVQMRTGRDVAEATGVDDKKKWF